MFLCLIGNWICVKITWGTSVLVAMSLFNYHHLGCGNIFTPSLKYEYFQTLSKFILKVSPLSDAHLSFLSCFSISSITRCKQAIIPLHSHCCYCMLHNGIFASKGVQWHGGKVMGMLSYGGRWVQSHSVACLILTQLASDCAVQPCFWR